MTPTHHPVAVSVHVEEEMVLAGLLDLREDDVAVAGHAVVLDVEHNLVVPSDPAGEKNQGQAESSEK